MNATEKLFLKIRRKAEVKTSLGFFNVGPMATSDDHWACFVVIVTSVDISNEDPGKPHKENQSSTHHTPSHQPNRFNQIV